MARLDLPRPFKDLTGYEGQAALGRRGDLSTYPRPEKALAAAQRIIDPNPKPGWLGVKDTLQKSAGKLGMGG